jgi:hypothetical protein
MMKIHPITGMPLEDGRGALPEHVQAANHCAAIEAEGDKPRADALRKKLGIPLREDVAAAKSKADAERVQREKAAAAALPKLEALQASHDEQAKRLSEHHETIGVAIQRLDALEQNASEHKAMADRIAALEAIVSKITSSNKES